MDLETVLLCDSGWPQTPSFRLTLSNAVITGMHPLTLRWPPLLYGESLAGNELSQQFSPPGGRC